MDNSENPTREIRLETALSLIRHLYNVQLTAQDSRSAVADFCDKNRHHMKQYYFNENILDLTRLNVGPDTIYHITDLFLIHFMLFSVAGVPYILGPFTTVLLTERETLELFEQHGIYDLSAELFLRYRSAFPSIEESAARNIVTSFISAVEPEEANKIVRRIDYTNSDRDVESPTGGQQEHHNRLIQSRYGTEKQFYDALSKADYRAAIHYLHTLQRDVSYVKQRGSTLENFRIGAAIVRTTARMAAINVGLPTLIIDRIASVSASETRHSKNLDCISDSQEKMVREFCKAIHEMKSNQYSALTQSVLYCLDHDYMTDIRFSQLAEDLTVSEGYLISCFRKEVGVTPNAYLTKMRMKKASLMLIHSTIPINEVSTSAGILDSNYFVKLFKKEYGETPSAYRKRYAT